MKQKLRNYFIGKFLNIPDLFDKANAIILYQFSIVFVLIFSLQVFSDVMLGFHKATIKHSVDVLLLVSMPFAIRHFKKLEFAVNYFFFLVFITTFLATMMLNAQHLDGICVSRIMFFIFMSALLQKGQARTLFCCFFGWLPFFYVIVNIKLNGALTWDWIKEPEAKELPAFLIFIPIVLGIYAIWNHTKTIRKTKETIITQNDMIKARNIAITDSINYAQRIQQAMMPRAEEIKSAFPESFVLFKPKDIVSGDFYYFNANQQGTFIASADCTGHGVPGAFMSMIGSEKLNQAVLHSTDTSEILRQLNKGIKKSLRQSSSDESTRDGMDIAICSVDKINRIVKYAGANRPLWIIHKEQSVVKEIKGTKQAIAGLTEDGQHFDTHEIALQQGDTFYIFTDGYADTFGGKKQKKLTTKKFKEILLSIQEKSMQDQKSYLDNFIENWRYGLEQLDDILVIGIRL